MAHLTRQHEASKERDVESPLAIFNEREHILSKANLGAEYPCTALLCERKGPFKVLKQIKHIIRIKRVAKIGTIFKHSQTFYHACNNPVEGRIISPVITVIKGNEDTESSVGKIEIGSFHLDVQVKCDSSSHHVQKCWRHPSDTQSLSQKRYTLKEV